MPKIVLILIFGRFCPPCNTSALLTLPRCRHRPGDTTWLWAGRVFSYANIS